MSKRSNTKETSVSLRDFYFDTVSSALIMLLCLVVFTIFSIAFTNSRVDGMGAGLVIGYFVSLGIFYFLRSRVNFLWTMVQIVLTFLLTLAGFSFFSLLLENTSFFEASYGYIAILVLTPMLQSLCKQILDFLAFRLNVNAKVRRFRF